MDKDNSGQVNVEQKPQGQEQPSTFDVEDSFTTLQQQFFENVNSDGDSDETEQVVEAPTYIPTAPLIGLGPQVKMGQRFVGPGQVPEDLVDEKNVEGHNSDEQEVQDPSLKIGEHGQMEESKEKGYETDYVDKFLALEPAPVVIGSSVTGISEGTENATIGLSATPLSSEDLLYMTCISSLMIITLLVSIVMYYYKQIQKETKRTPNDASGQSFLQKLLGRGDQGNSSAGRGRRDLRYDHFSDEETNSLLNMSKAVAYTASERSFFEKISTGSNTDSDLRVIRCDPSQLNDKGEYVYREAQPSNIMANDEDQVPKVKVPIVSQKSSQDNAILSTQYQGKVPQFLLFEDFKVREDGYTKQSNTDQPGSAQQIQLNQSAAAATGLLMEDWIGTTSPDMKVAREEGAGEAQEHGDDASLSMLDEKINAGSRPKTFKEDEAKVLQFNYEEDSDDELLGQVLIKTEQKWE